MNFIDFWQAHYMDRVRGNPCITWTIGFTKTYNRMLSKTEVTRSPAVFTNLDAFCPRRAIIMESRWSQ